VQVTEHRYDRGSIIKDYVMGGIGFAIMALPIVSTDLGTVMLTIFGGLALLFGVYLFRTWARSTTVYLVDATGIRSEGPQNKALPWEDIREMEIRYFSTRRDRNGGWMQLTLGDGSRGGAKRLSIESTLENFSELALKAGEAAERNGLELSETTRDNLTALATTGIPMRETNLEPGLRSARDLGRDYPGNVGDKGPGSGRGGF